MRDQEIIGLYEAYNQICESSEILSEKDEMEQNPLLHLTYAERAKRLKDKAEQIRRKKGKNIRTEELEYFTEEVQIAAQYFYEMGLNEEGVEILIEDLGLDEFVEFISNIIEEHTLTEARRSGTIEPKTAKGQEIKGKPSGASLKRLRRLKAERKESEERASAEKPSGLKSSLRRQSAIANAKHQQPKKKGVLDRVAGAVLAGIERHNAAMSAAKETGKTIRKAAEKVGGVAREVGKGAVGAAKFAAAVTKEEYDLFDTILEHLVAEGYADTNEAALVIMTNMSEEWRESIVEESRGAKLRAKHGDNPSKKLETKAFRKAMSYENRDRLPTGTGTEVRGRYLGLSGRARSRAGGETPASSAVGPRGESRTVRSRGGRSAGIGAGENRDRPAG